MAFSSHWSDWFFTFFKPSAILTYWPSSRRISSPTCFIFFLSSSACSSSSSDSFCNWRRPSPKALRRFWSEVDVRFWRAWSRRSVSLITFSCADCKASYTFSSPAFCSLKSGAPLSRLSISSLTVLALSRRASSTWMAALPFIERIISVFKFAIIVFVLN